MKNADEQVKTNMKDAHAKLDAHIKAEEEKIKDTIRWGDDEHPLTEGDELTGVVEALEFGKSEDTAQVLFCSIRGEATLGGETSKGLFSVLIGSVLNSFVKSGVIETGKTVAIRYLGTRTSQKRHKDYKSYVAINP